MYRGTEQPPKTANCFSHRRPPMIASCLGLCLSFYVATNFSVYHQPQGAQALCRQSHIILLAHVKQVALLTPCTHDIRLHPASPTWSFKPLCVELAACGAAVQGDQANPGSSGGGLPHLHAAGVVHMACLPLGCAALVCLCHAGVTCCNTHMLPK